MTEIKKEKNWSVGVVGNKENGYEVVGNENVIGHAQDIDEAHGVIEQFVVKGGVGKIEFLEL